jgi:CRP/FNR family transcriptional regulator, cyclic AMP receptor protein
MIDAKNVAQARSVLERCPLFAAIEEGRRRDLAAKAMPRSFAAGRPICRIGEPGLSMMVVISGTVRISLPSMEGKEVILADLSPGEIFGEIAVLDGKPRSANATAVTRCELLVLERRNVIPFFETNSAACLKLMEILCARIRRSDERMADIAFFDLPTRLAKLLLKNAATHRGVMKLSFSQKELAKMAAASREQINRCLRDWQRRGIVDLSDGWTIILKADELRRFVDPI